MSHNNSMDLIELSDSDENSLVLNSDDEDNNTSESKIYLPILSEDNCDNNRSEKATSREQTNDDDYSRGSEENINSFKEGASNSESSGEDGPEEGSEDDQGDSNDEENSEDSNLSVHEITLIQKENIEVDEPKIMEFISFCIDKNLFDNTFYDYNNAFSVIATKLPITFEKLSDDGENIPKERFIKVYKDTYHYEGDIEFVYNQMDTDQKDYITWEEYTDFFLPFVKYITI